MTDSNTPEGFTLDEWRAIPPAQRLHLYLSGEMADDPPEGFNGESPFTVAPYAGMVIDPKTLSLDLQRVILEANAVLAGSPWSSAWKASDPDCPRHYRAPGDGGLTIGEVDDFCSGAATWYRLADGLDVNLHYGQGGFEIEVI